MLVQDYRRKHDEIVWCRHLFFMKVCFWEEIRSHSVWKIWKKRRYWCILKFITVHTYSGNFISEANNKENVGPYLRIKTLKRSREIGWFFFYVKQFGVSLQHLVPLGSAHHMLVVLHSNAPTDKTTNLKVFTQKQAILLNFIQCTSTLTIMEVAFTVKISEFCGGEGAWALITIQQIQTEKLVIIH